MSDIEFFVAPTEPPQFRAIASQVTLLPERYGCDCVWWGKHDGVDQLWGVQRKELKDLIASVGDGRLAREIAQMTAGGIPVPMVIIEGKIQFDQNDNLMWNSWGQEFSRSQWKGMLWSLMLLGVHVDYSKDLRETISIVQMFAQWSLKGKHTSLMRRPGPVSPWGKPGNTDYEVHLLQGFDVLGNERAKAIIKHFGGVPLQWTVTEKQLIEVPGIGKGIAKKLLEALTISTEP